jgi:hypothetical protein
MTFTAALTSGADADASLFSAVTASSCDDGRVALKVLRAAQNLEPGAAAAGTAVKYPAATTATIATAPSPA